MKKILVLFITAFLLLFLGCSNSDSSDSSNPLSGIIGDGGGGGGTGNVTIQVQGQAGQDGNYYFYINPSVAIDLLTVTASVPAQSYNETININSQYQANNSQAVIYYAQNYIQTGQKWTFEFKGTITSSGQTFDVTTNYTIP